MARPPKPENREVTDFATALKAWAEEGPDREQKQRLLKWLLTRCESRMFVAPNKSSGPKDAPEADKYILKRIDIDEIEIEQAVIRAMAGYNPSLPTNGWIRGGPVWPKAYGDVWPKGYGEVWPKSYGS